MIPISVTLSAIKIVAVGAKTEIPTIPMYVSKLPIKVFNKPNSRLFPSGSVYVIGLFPAYPYKPQYSKLKNMY